MDMFVVKTVLGVAIGLFFLASYIAMAFKYWEMKAEYKLYKSEQGARTSYERKLWTKYAKAMEGVLAVKGISRIYCGDELVWSCCEQDEVYEGIVEELEYDR